MPFSFSRPVILTLVTLILFVAVTAGVFGFRLISFSGMSFDMPPPGVIVQRVEDRAFDDRIEAIGTSSAINGAALTANIAENVATIHFVEGSFVKAGDLLVELEGDEERAALAEAEQTLQRIEPLLARKAVSEAQREAALAARDMAAARLRDRQISAPFDGVVGLRNVSPGDLVEPGMVITTIDAVDPMELDFSVPERFLQTLAVGHTIEARAEAYADRVFTGTVIAIDSRIDPVTRAIRMKAHIPNPDRALRPGMLMRVAIVNNARRALAIAEEAVQNKGSTTSVLVVDSDDMVSERTITLGVRRAGYVEVISGLQKDERVIIEGGLKARPGETVSVTAEHSVDDQRDKGRAFAVDQKQEQLDRQ